MIIGYDFWCDYVYPNKDDEAISVDNDGVAFDTCNSISSLSNIKIQNAIYDELEILKDITSFENTTDKSTEWTVNTILLAKFCGNLIGGTAGINGNPISLIQICKRKTNEQEWQIYKEIDCEEGVRAYKYIDRFIEAEQEYEYCIRPVAIIRDKETKEEINRVFGEYSNSFSTYITYDNIHLVGKDNNGKDVAYPLIYNIGFGDVTKNISANVINTLSGQYPITVYGNSDYRSGNVKCLLVTEESTTGMINVGTEKVLRNNIEQFLSNKKPKVLKYADGTYMLVNVSDNFILTPNENLLGTYELTFNYVEIGDVNDIETLSKYGLLE